MLSGGGVLSHESHKFHTILVVLEIFALLMLLASITKIVSGSLAPMFWIGFIVLGLALPLIGGSKFMLQRCGVTKDGAVCGCSEGIKSCVYNEYGVLIGGFCLRAFIVLGAVYIF